MAQEASRPAPQPVSKLAEQRKPNVRVFALTQQKAETADTVVVGTLLINSVPAFTLFNYGAIHFLAF
jgi:hypothetical protein